MAGTQHGHGHHGHGHDHPHDPYVGAGAAYAESHHGHQIVSKGMLIFVFTALLILTGATVGAAEVEKFIASTFEFIIPQWVNVFVALSIASVKTTLVVMYFMQLRYDNPLNSLIFIFCLFTVACFLGFTMIDLGNRGTIDRFKARQIVEGGTGYDTVIARTAAEQAGWARPANEPITEIARQAYQAKVDAGLVKPKAHDDGHGYGHGYGMDMRFSSPNWSRPGLTLTPGFFGPDWAAKPEHDDHGDHAETDAHGEGAADESHGGE